MAAVTGNREGHDGGGAPGRGGTGRGGGGLGGGLGGSGARGGGGLGAAHPKVGLPAPRQAGPHHGPSRRVAAIVEPVTISALPAPPLPAVAHGLPPVPLGRWTIDPQRALVSFSGRVHRLAPLFRARFGRVEGHVVVAENPLDAVVDVRVDVTSMTSGNRAYDDILAALDPLEVGTHPEASFRSDEVDLREARAVVRGELTLHGCTRRIELDGVPGVDAATGTPLLRATGVVDRTDFGIRCDVPGLAALVPRRLTLDIAVSTLPVALG